MLMAHRSRKLKSGREECSAWKRNEFFGAKPARVRGQFQGQRFPQTVIEKVK
jgi:hypothetical protein